MGILENDLRWLLDNTSKNKSMLELGNQFLYIFSKPWADYPSEFVTNGHDMVAAKLYFQRLGYDHTSIDLNGQDGALSLDLGAPFQLAKQFDIVTDFGTSEHVSSLFHCLQNIDTHTKVGGKIFHVNPLVGNWPEHGFWYRDEDFYKAFAKMTGYKIKDMHRIVACGNYTDGWNICCLLEKTDKSRFPSENEFNTLPIKTK